MMPTLNHSLDVEKGAERTCTLDDSRIFEVFYVGLEALNARASNDAHLRTVEPWHLLSIELFFEPFRKLVLFEVDETVAEIAFVANVHWQVEEVVKAGITVKRFQQHSLRVAVGNVAQHHRCESVVFNVRRSSRTAFIGVNDFGPFHYFVHFFVHNCGTAKNRVAGQGPASAGQSGRIPKVNKGSLDGDV